MDDSATKDLLSNFNTRLIQKNSRGKLENSVVLSDQLGKPPRNKRKWERETVPIEDASRKPDGGCGKKKMEASDVISITDDDLSTDLKLGKALVASDETGGSERVECTWCKKTYVNRFAMAGHSQFCIRKPPVTKKRKRSKVRRKNFDLNLKPAEAWAVQTAVARMKRESP